MLINIFCVLLLVRIFPSTLGDLRIQNFQRQQEEFIYSDNILRLRISYIYEINKDTKLTSSDVRKKVESAIEQVSKAMKAGQYNSYDQTILYIESIRPFHNSGKPLAHYNAAELSRFLNNDAHFGKLSKRTDNTQIIAFGDHFETEYPEEHIGWAFDSRETLQLPDEDVWNENDFYNPTEKIKTKPKKKITFKRKNSKLQDTPVAVTTFKDICSKKSRGIVIDHEGSTLNIAKLLARNFACAAGIYDKRVCLRGFREYDIKSFKCDVHWIVAFPKLCFIHSMLQNSKKGRWTRTNHTCTTNRLIRHKPSTQKSSLFMEDDSFATDVDEEDEEEDDESGATKIVFVLLAVSGSFLFLAVLVGICLWRINRRNKTKKLTKDRVSVNYKYDPMKRTDRQSIITDPTVTNDLE